MRSSTTTLLSTAALIAALAGGCGNSNMVERFDPAPSAAPQTASNAQPASKNNTRTTATASNNNRTPAPRTAANTNAPVHPAGGAIRTGPITPEFIAQMEITGNRSGAPVVDDEAVAEEKPSFDRSSLVFTAGTDKDTPADSADGLTQITFATEGADFDPRISRDGQTLVYSSTQHRATADLYIKKVGSRAVTQITNDPSNHVMPALSPDGKRIAFASDRNGTWQLFVMGAAGGRAIQLSPDNACDLHPTWSPDGKKLAFCRLGTVSGRWEMWVVDSNNPSSAEFIGYGMFPVWCPVAGTGENGTDKIAYQRGKERGDRAFGLWTVDYKPGFVSSPTEIVSGANAAAINPNWSPDGQFIAYATVKPGHTDSSAGVWIVAADGSVSVNLTGGAGGCSDMSPWWSKDGRVYFVSDRSGHDNIWSVGTDRAMAAISRDTTQPVATNPAPANTADPANDPNASNTANVPTNP